MLGAPRRRRDVIVRQRIAARRYRLRAIQPGNVDGRIVQRGLAGREPAPGLDRVFGFLDIFQKREFAVIAAPAPGLEQFGEVIEPLLGQRAPAVENLLAPRHVHSLCHEKVRKEENGRKTQRINPSPDLIFCGKLLPCPAIARMTRWLSTESAAGVAFSSQSTVKPRQDMAAMRALSRMRTTQTALILRSRRSAASRRMAKRARGHPSRRGQEAAPQDETCGWLG